MPDIEVISKTQTIVLSGSGDIMSVAVVSSGPAGPPGPPGYSLGSVSSIVYASQIFNSTSYVDITGLSPLVFEVTDRPWVVELAQGTIYTDAGVGERYLSGIIVSTAVSTDKWAQGITSSGDANSFLGGIVTKTIFDQIGEYSVKAQCAASIAEDIIFGTNGVPPNNSPVPSPTFFSAKELPA